MSIYDSHQWKKFRRSFIERHGHYCDICERDSNDNEEIVFQIHHKQYLKGKLPWEYDDGELELLCKGCHAKIHDKIPNYEWVYKELNDLGSLDGTCGFCGREIRYEHIVYHEYWGERKAGAICADNVLENQIATNISKYWYINEKNKKLTDFINSSSWNEVLGNWGYNFRKKCANSQIRIRINIQKSNENTDLFSISIDYISKTKNGTLLKLKGEYELIYAKKIAFIAKNFIEGKPKGWNIRDHNGYENHVFEIFKEKYMVYKEKYGTDWKFKVSIHGQEIKKFNDIVESIELAKCKLFEWYFDNIAQSKISLKIEEPSCVKEA